MLTANDKLTPEINDGQPIDNTFAVEMFGAFLSSCKTHKINGGT